MLNLTEEQFKKYLALSKDDRRRWRAEQLYLAHVAQLSPPVTDEQLLQARKLAFEAVDLWSKSEEWFHNASWTPERDLPPPPVDRHGRHVSQGDDVWREWDQAPSWATVVGLYATSVNTPPVWMCIDSVDTEGSHHQLSECVTRPSFAADENGHLVSMGDDIISPSGTCWQVIRLQQTEVGMGYTTAEHERPVESAPIGRWVARAARMAAHGVPVQTFLDLRLCRKVEARRAEPRDQTGRIVRVGDEIWVEPERSTPGTGEGWQVVRELANVSTGWKAILSAPHGPPGLHVSSTRSRAPAIMGPIDKNGRGVRRDDEVRKDGGPWEQARVFTFESDKWFVGDAVRQELILCESRDPNEPRDKEGRLVVQGDEWRRTDTGKWEPIETLTRSQTGWRVDDVMALRYLETRAALRKVPPGRYDEDAIDWCNCSVFSATTARGLVLTLTTMAASVRAARGKLPKDILCRSELGPVSTAERVHQALTSKFTGWVPSPTVSEYITPIEQLFQQAYIEPSDVSQIFCAAMEEMDIPTRLVAWAPSSMKRPSFTSLLVEILVAKGSAPGVWVTMDVGSPCLRTTDDVLSTFPGERVAILVNPERLPPAKEKS